MVALLAGTGCTINELRASYHGANALDVIQTERGLDQGCTEGSWMAGSHPSDAKLVGLALFQSGVAEFVCGRAGPGEKACWTAFLGLKVLAIGWNASQHCGP